MNSPVADYYAGKTIMLTGGTGFIGKVLVEKILRCCPDVDKFYLLIRPKAGQDPQQRIKKEFVECKVSTIKGLKQLWLHLICHNFHKGTSSFP